jgi:hypothetical protein
MEKYGVKIIMCYLSKAICCSLLIFFSLSTNFGQTGEKNSIEKAKIRKSDYKDWQKVELSNLSFYIPKELKKQETKCIDGGCYLFKSEELKLSIDVNSAAGFPTYEKKNPTYSEKFFQIDDAKAWIWSVENDRYKYESGVLFEFEKIKNYRIGMYLFSESQNIKDLAKKIFKSVKFKNKPKR